MKKIAILALLALAAGLAFFALPPAPSQPQDAGTGTPAIGGAFTLTDQHGKQVGDAAFRGKLMLVFFGFTRCPDICPVTTKTFSDLMGELGDKAEQVAPVFITVDPAHDTPTVLADFLSNFDSRIVGLTGTEAEVNQVASAYKAYYAKHDTEATKTNPDDYTMDHSGFIYLMDRDGKYLSHFPYDIKTGALAEALKPYLK